MIKNIIELIIIKLKRNILLYFQFWTILNIGWNC